MKTEDQIQERIKEIESGVVQIDALEALKWVLGIHKKKYVSQSACRTKLLYRGEEDHGYWWIHPSKGDLKFTKNPNDSELVTFFKYSSNASCEWWHVKCELDWYRMRKEYRELRGGCDKCST
jgi:hypothetical protein